MSDLANRCDALAVENRELRAALNAQAREIAKLRSDRAALADQLSHAVPVRALHAIEDLLPRATPAPNRPVSRNAAVPRDHMAAGATGAASVDCPDAAPVAELPQRCRACRTRPVWDHRIGLCEVCQHKRDDYAADAAADDPPEIDPDPREIDPDPDDDDRWEA